MRVGNFGGCNIDRQTAKFSGYMVHVFCLFKGEAEVTVSDDDRNDADDDEGKKHNLSTV